MTVYTCITSKVDKIPEPQHIMSNCNYLCFSDTLYKSKVWQIRPLLKQFENSTLTARYHKTQAILSLDDDKFLWQDGKVIMHDAGSLFRCLNGHDFLFFAHPIRNCIYEEAKKVIEMGKEKANKIKRQCNYYQDLGHVTKQLFETCVFLINKNKMTVKLLNAWWEEIENYSYRDQISLPFVLQNSEIKYNCLQNPYDQIYFNVNHHAIRNRIVKLL